MIGKKVFRGASLSSWCVVSFCAERFCPTEQLDAFVRELVVTCHGIGMNIIVRSLLSHETTDPAYNTDRYILYMQEKTPRIFYVSPQGDIESLMRQHYTTTGNRYNIRPQVIVCILPNTGVQLYAEIKRVSDTVLGLPTQCLQMKHTKVSNKQYCANVCLKLNTKLGGTNGYIKLHEMPFLSEGRAIIMGADVRHPPPGDDAHPSIAAVVGSIDKEGTRFASAIRIQTSRVEIIADMKDMVKEILCAFHISTGVSPQRILFYRDGVSEGQFATVLAEEVCSSF
jgi:hypothetical protein